MGLLWVPKEMFAVIDLLKLKLLRSSLVLLLLVIATLSGGCGADASADMQGIFTKNGIMLMNAVKPGDIPQEIVVRVNGESKEIQWQIMGGKNLILAESWEPWQNYEIEINGRKWNGTAPLTPTAAVLATGELGKLEETPSLKEWSPVVYEDVAVSPDGRFIGIASFDHKIYLYDNTGKKLWDYGIPDGVGVAIAFARDGLSLFVGESSPEANCYAFDTLSGKKLWQYSFSGDIGSDSTPKWNNRPKITSIAVMGNQVVASAEYTQRVTERLAGKAVVKYVTSCLIRAFDNRTGSSNWRYPQEETMDTGVSRLTFSADGSKLVFANHSWSKGQRYLDGSIRILDGATGRVLGIHQLEEPKDGQCNYIGIFDGIHISPNGRYLAVVTADNRGMLFDISHITIENSEQGASTEFPLLWLRQISNVQRIGGVPVYAYGNTAHTTDDGQVLFMTGATFLADKTATSGAPPFVHPDSTTLFFYRSNGELMWKWQSDGGIGKLRFSGDGRYLVLPIYHNYITRKKDKAGLYCFDLIAAQGKKLLWFYPLEGIAVTAGVAENGTTAAGVEVPVRQSDDTLLGTHRLHILQ